MIVDTHVHVVSDDLKTYPLNPAGRPGAWYREAPHTAEQLLALMSVAGVDRAVLVQGVGAYSFDNAYVADSAAKHPEHFASVCCIDANGHDPVGALPAERPHEARVLLADPVRCGGEIESDDPHVVRRQSRAELHRLSGADDPVGARHDQGAPLAGRTETPVDQLAGVDRQPAAPEDLQDRPQPQCFQC